MNITKTTLDYDEYCTLVNIINEVCNGFYINNLEKATGFTKQTAIIFFKKILQKKGEERAVELVLEDSEIIFIKNSFGEIFKEIDEWEFETRLGVTIPEALKIRDKFKTSISS
ncbi:MAG: hypothetical protein H0T62_06670 [Parachlamydiaceae bacterium]|nr:hypothetical protein [Parachlamydiaceae bacterium]